jgi:integrase
MAHRKCWSKTVGAVRGTRARVYEREPGGTLQMSVWIAGQGERRRSLGHNDRGRAVDEAKAIVTLRATSGDIAPEPSQVTLGELCEEYLAQASHTRAGCLISEAHRKSMAQSAVTLLRWFGHDCPAESLTETRVAAYARARRAGRVSRRAVRTRSVHGELSFLKSVLKWATRDTDGKPRITRNLLAGYGLERERDPRRPAIDDHVVDRLLAVAPDIHPLLPLLIVLTGSTGRRLSSVLGLMWEDIDLTRRTVTWRAELDKGRRTWVGPLPDRAAATLLDRLGTIGLHARGFLFPARRKPGKSVSRHLAADWLKKAYRTANVAKPVGSLWHCFRRKWATDRKNYPVVDVAAAGGWRDIRTLLTCYQQPDPDTMRAVVERRPIDQKLTHELTHLNHKQNGAA